jgi:hypothetical protein
MIRSLIFVGVLALGFAARAESTTVTACSKNMSGTVVEASIGVSSEADANGHVIRSLIASTLAFGDVPVSPTQLDCSRNFCSHIGDPEELKISYRLYPHFKHNSGELSSITLNSASTIMTDSMELTNCKVVDQYPQYP